MSPQNCPPFPPADERKPRLDLQLARVLSNPLRLQILGSLATDGSSAKQLAEELDQELGRVAYHAAVLMRTGCIQRTEPSAEGASPEHFYELTKLAGNGRLPRTQPPRTLSLVLDSVGWEKVTGLIEKTLEQVAAAQAESARRLKTKGAGGIEATLTVAGLPET